MVAWTSLAIAVVLSLEVADSYINFVSGTAYSIPDCRAISALFTGVCDELKYPVLKSYFSFSLGP